MQTAELLAVKNISVEVIDVRTVKPVDYDTILKSAMKTGILYSIEENLKRGGMGEMILSELKIRNIDIKAGVKAIDDEFITHASISDLNEMYGYTPKKIAKDIERMLES